MNEVLKQRYTSLRHELNEIKTNIKIGEEKIKSQEETMKRLEENRDEQIDKLKKNILKSTSCLVLKLGKQDRKL